tara:strand:- start:15 stop:530 length:516 start_codon:yes stop_codon:yes gene_type:complete
MKYILIVLNLCISVTLQEAYDNAEPNEEYEKYIILEPNQTYTGGLGIYEGDIYINCQGSIVDLENQNGIWIYADETYLSSLEIEYCNVINGAYYGLSFSGTAIGKISNCNFYNNEFGVKAGDSSNIDIENTNFISNEIYGLGIITEVPIITISYSNSWNNGNGDYWENCPG